MIADAAGTLSPVSLELLTEVEERYEIEITWGDGPYRYDTDWGWGAADSAADWEVEMFAPIVAEELSPGMAVRVLEISTVGDRKMELFSNPCSVAYVIQEKSHAITIH